MKTGGGERVKRLKCADGGSDNSACDGLCVCHSVTWRHSEKVMESDRESERG